jgi:Domain of Unknown Function (DUF1080)
LIQHSHRIAVTAVLALASVLIGANPASALSDDFESHRAGTRWTDGTSHGSWQSVFDGYGSIGVTNASSKVLSLKPMESDTSSETHAALVRSKKSFGNVQFKVRAKTVKQLRSPSPNAWESAWVIWHYSDNTHFYYLALKPNGWELGKADPRYPGAQRFLATGSNKRFPIGSWSKVKVRQVGRRISVWADGHLLTRFRDTERPYRKGSVGLYNEDAKTYFDNVRARSI